jgi:hypothetical protein
MAWNGILEGLTGGAAGAAIAFTLLKSIAEKRFDSALRRAEEVHHSLLTTANTIDTDLRAHRIEVYTELWKMTRLVSRWPRNHNLTHRELQHFTEQLRSWYFERGGIYLSASARSAYGQVQESLEAIVKNGEDLKVNDADYDTVQGRCSELRSQLTSDLLSRREAPRLSQVATTAQSAKSKQKGA